MSLEWLLERSWKPPEPKKGGLEGSWSRLGALKIASRWPEGDRPEVNERLARHLWLAMAPGKPYYQRLSIKNNKTQQLYTGSEHALGQRPGELVVVVVVVATQVLSALSVVRFLFEYPKV